MTAREQGGIHPAIVDISVTKHILKAFGLRASKGLGQNFLISPIVLKQIVHTAEIELGDSVLEIGPGIGTLTQGLLEAGAKVTAVELDKRLPDVLAETLKGYENLSVIQGDILKIDIGAIMKEKPFKVVANLPYYVTTPILMYLLEKKLPIERVVVMVQKEVAERMTAAPGSRIYGSLSVATAYYTEPSIAFLVPSKSFLPPPKVESAVVLCKRLKTPSVDVSDEVLFFRVVRGAFGQRRKTLFNALAGAGFDKDNLKQAFDSLRLDPKRRGETLSITDFADLANVLANGKVLYV